MYILQSHIHVHRKPFNMGGGIPGDTTMCLYIIFMYIFTVTHTKETTACNYSTHIHLQCYYSVIHMFEHSICTYTYTTFIYVYVYTHYTTTHIPYIYVQSGYTIQYYMYIYIYIYIYTHTIQYTCMYIHIIQ